MTLTLTAMNLNDNGLYDTGHEVEGEDSEAPSLPAPAAKPIIDAESGPASPSLLDRRHFHATFESDAYLKSFYTRVEEPAMQVVLIFLPKIVARLEQRAKGGLAKLRTLLDFGAGPTIHVAVCFRSLVREIYLADHLPQNRDALFEWLAGRSHFDWRHTLRIIADQEGFSLPCTALDDSVAPNKVQCQLGRMERQAKSKVVGVLSCDALADPPLTGFTGLRNANDAPDKGRFDIVTTFFTLEYCCLTTGEYARAVRRVAALVRPHGYFIIGSCLDESWCAFGGRRYRLLPVSREDVVDSMRQAGTAVDDTETVVVYEVNGVLIVCAKKTAGE